MSEAQTLTQVQPERQRGENFFEVLPDGRWAFWLDHHLIDGFNTCERKFYWKHVRLLRPKGPTRVVLSIGSWWSAVMEDYYNEMSKGTLTKIKAIGFAAKQWQELKMDDMKLAEPKKYEKFAMRMGPADLKLISHELGVAADDIDGLVPMGPLLMIVRYHDCYFEHDSRHWKILAAEKGFGLRGEVLLGENKDVVVYYVGKPDLTIYEQANNVLAPLDHKTNDYIPWDVQVKYKPHAQTAGYIFAIQKIARDLGYDQIVDRCIINVCGRIESKEGKARFTRVYPGYAPDELEEWRRMLIEKATRLRQCIEHDEWIWKESSCHLYGGCEYRGIDAVPPQTRGIIIESSYQVVPPWSPYEVDE